LNPASEPSGSIGVEISNMRSPHRRSWFFWSILSVVLLLGCVLLLALVLPSPQPEPLVVLKPPFSPPISLRDRIGSFIPRGGSWAWADRTLDKLFGRRRPLTLDAEAFAFKGAYTTRQLELELGRPSYALAHEGFAVWFLSWRELNDLRVRLENEPLCTGYRSRVSTAEGITASLFMGESVVLNGVTNNVGIAEAYFPRFGANGLDLFTSLLVSQLATNVPEHFVPNQPARFIQTNADFALRMQIPDRRAVFLLKRDSLNGKSAALVLEPR
jgi:hypothetical protein